MCESFMNSVILSAKNKSETRPAAVQLEHVLWRDTGMGRGHQPSQEGLLKLDFLSLGKKQFQGDIKAAPPKLQGIY